MAKDSLEIYFLNMHIYITFDSFSNIRISYWSIIPTSKSVIKIYNKILNELYFINLRYEDSEDELIDDEPVEFLEAEGRKRPKRPTNIKFNPFDDPLDFVPR